MDNSIRPGYRGGGGHYPRGPESSIQYGVNDNEVARLRGLVNDLLSRVKKLEDDAIYATGNNGERGAEIQPVSAPGVAEHYHSILVYPGTSTAALEIDTDGGAIYQNIWKDIIDANNRKSQYDDNLGIGARNWVTKTNDPPNLD